jgi:hypothetical protein
MLLGMAHKTERKPKLTDAQRHARFIETARKVGASEDPKDFDEAFKSVVQPKKIVPPKSSPRSR